MTPIKTGLPGRPRLMKKTVRVIVQMESSTYERIKKIVKGEKSIAQFFRDAADAALTTE